MFDLSTGLPRTWWEPFREMERLQHEVNRIFDHSTPAYVPKLDVVEDDKELRISAELPGMDEQDVEVSLMEDLLVIRGEKKTEHAQSKKHAHLIERSFGAFQRAVRLPDNVDREKIDAAFTKGVLTIALPKTAPAREQVKKIPVKSA